MSKFILKNGILRSRAFTRLVHAFEIFPMGIGRKPWFISKSVLQNLSLVLSQNKSKTESKLVVPCFLTLRMSIAQLWLIRCTGNL